MKYVLERAENFITNKQMEPCLKLATVYPLVASLAADGLVLFSLVSYQNLI